MCVCVILRIYVFLGGLFSLFCYYFAIVSHRLTFYEQIKVSAQKRQSEKEMAKHRKQFAPLSQNIFGIIFVLCVRFTSFLSNRKFRVQAMAISKTIIHIRLNGNIVPSMSLFDVSFFFFLLFLLWRRQFLISFNFLVVFLRPVNAIRLFRLLCDVCACV